MARVGSARIRVSVEGAGPEAAKFDVAARRLQDRLIAELRDLGDRGTATMRGEIERVGRVDTGQMRDNVRAVPFLRAARPQVTILAEAIRDDYNYVAVTRFGHRKSTIKPTSARNLAVHLSGHREEPTFMRSVSGFGYGRQRPVDWAESGAAVIDGDAEITASRLGRQIETELLPGTRLR